MDSMTPQQLWNQWASIWPRLVARSWTDDAFRKTLIEQPVQVLRDNGLELDPRLNLKVVPGTDPQTIQIDGVEPVLILRLPNRPERLDREALVQLEGNLFPHPAVPVGTWFCWC
jgi:hypothetical protein